MEEEIMNQVKKDVEQIWVNKIKKIIFQSNKYLSYGNFKKFTK